MKTKTIKKIITFSSILILLVVFSQLISTTEVFAEGEVKIVNPIGGTEENPKGEIDIRLILGGLVEKGLTVLGTLTLLVFVAGGALWLTSAGNADRVKKGSTTMLYAVIGIFVIFSSYAILNTILSGLKVGTPDPLRPSISSPSGGNTSGAGSTTNGSIDCTTLDQVSSFTFSCLEKTKCSQGSNVNKELNAALALIARQVEGPVKSSSGDISVLGNAFKNACPTKGNNIVCCVDPNAAQPQNSGELTRNQKLERLCELSGSEDESFACRTTAFCDKDKTSSLISCGDSTKSCCVAKELSRNETKKVEACRQFGTGYDCQNQSTCERVESGAPVCPGPRSGSDKVACCIAGEPKSTCEVKFDGLSCLAESECEKSTVGSVIITTEFDGAGKNLKNVKGRKLQLNTGNEKWEIKNACDLTGQRAKCCIPKV